MKKRIAIISDHASPLAHLGGVDSGGQNVYVDQIAKQLSRLGYSVDIFTRWDNEKLPKVISYQEHIRIIHISAGPKAFIPKEHLLKYTKDFYEDMLSFIEKDAVKYQLIHANFFISGDVAQRLKKKLGIQYVITFHALGRVRRKYQGKQDGFPNKRFAIEERIIKFADQIIAECPQDREDLLTYYHADQQKISIIPCGYDPNEFYPIDTSVARITLGLDSSKKYILQLGRMVPRKGIDTVITALAELQKIYSQDVELLIVGGESDSPNPSITPEIGRLQTVATLLGIQDRIHFFGRRDRDELKYFYNAADIFVSTPWYEPFGITPLESMACGTPVIGSRVGGIQFSVLHGKTGFLVNPKDPHELAIKMKEIFNNTSLSQAFSESGIKRVQSFFTWTTVGQALSSVFEKIIYTRATSVEEYQILTHTVDTNFDSLLHALTKSKEKLRLSVARASRAIAQAIQQGGKVLLCGNGGSATDAQHFAAELMGHFKYDNRSPFPFVSLTTDTAVITAIANDYSYQEVFARQVEALGQPGDVLVAISTSGTSKNIIHALQIANTKNMICIGLTGKNGGKMIEYCDISLIVPSDTTQIIQEVHTHLIHSLSELIEMQLAQNKKKNHSISQQGSKNGTASYVLDKKNYEES